MRRAEREAGRLPRQTADNAVLPFRTVTSGVLGRLVRLGTTADTILARHAYPEPVSRTLGEALAIASLLGTALKGDGKFILQTKSDGPLGFLVVNFETPGRLRAYASADAERVAAATGRADLLGKGHLAMTIDRGGETDRYQGIVPLDGGTLPAAAHSYFLQSEQIPTYLRVAVARHYGTDATGARTTGWRVGGLLVQYVPPVEVGIVASEEEERLVGEREEAWQRTRLLAATVEDHELLDPMLAPEMLLYRLFHEEGVRVEPERLLEPYCTCSRERVKTFLKGFGARELSDMREADGAIGVTCEYCTNRYRFELAEIA
jgi:molecular chaperone Hsp33